MCMALAGGSQIELSPRGQCLFLRVATFLAPLSREQSNADLRKGSRAASRRLQMSPESPASLTTRLTQGSPRLASFAIAATDSESTQDRLAKDRRLVGSALSTPRRADLFGSIRPVARSVGRDSLLAHLVAAVKSRRNESPPPQSEHLKRKPSRIAPRRSAAIAAPQESSSRHGCCFRGRLSWRSGPCSTVGTKN
jgi:hypothetical protein